MGSLRLLRFALPSILGIFFFCVRFAIREAGRFRVGAFRRAGEQAWRQSALYRLCAGAYLRIALGLLLAGQAENSRHSRLEQLFTVTPLWLALRVIGAIFGAMIIWRMGPELVWSETTGHIVVYDLLTAIVTIFVCGLFAAAAN